MHPIAFLLYMVLNLYFWILVIWIVVAWLIQFGIINQHNNFVRQLNHALYKVTEPVLAPIRRRLPNTGSVDLSPIILVIAIHFLQYTLRYYF